MSSNIKCSQHNPNDYRDKKLVWFDEEGEGHFILFPSVSPGGDTFDLAAAAVGLVSPGSAKKKNQIAVVTKQIDENTMRKMKKPESKFLKPLCDYVIFDNSPHAEAKFAGYLLDKIIDACRSLAVLRLLALLHSHTKVVGKNKCHYCACQ